MAVDLQGFGQVRPAEFDYGSVFDRVRNAYKAGLLSRAEVEEAIRVIPAEQNARVAEAGLRAATAGEGMKVLPLKSELEQMNLDWMKREGAGLQQKKARLDVQQQEQQVQDPLGVGKYAASELLKLGKPPSGNPTKDLADLEVAQKEQAQKVLKMKQLAALIEDAQKEGIAPQIDPDDNLDVQIVKLTNELNAKRTEREGAELQNKERVKLIESATEKGVKFGELNPYTAPIEQLRELVTGQAAEAAKTKETAEVQKLAMDLRKEFNALPEVKAGTEMASAVRGINAVLSKPKTTGQDDLAAIYQFVKLLDPGSVVREGEIQLSNQAVPALRQMVNRFNRFFTGEIFDDASRKNLLQTARELYEAKTKGIYETTIPQYQKLAQQFGARPEDVISFPSVEQVLGAPSAAQPPAAPANPQTTPPKVTNFEAGKVYTLTPKGGVPGQYLYLGGGKFRPAP